MGISGDWRDRPLFWVAFLVGAVVVPAALAILVGDFSGGVRVAAGVALVLVPLALLGWWLGMRSKSGRHGRRT